MGRTINIGGQGFASIREHDYFLVDKTGFIRDWWDAGDQVTLICRPRRFGKTLNLSMVECFLSMKYAGRGEELFGGLDIWQEGRFRDLQGTVPVIALSFAKVKEGNLAGAVASMKRILCDAVHVHDYLRESSALNEVERAFLDSVTDDMTDDIAADCLNRLCSMLEKHHGVKPVVLLDEYDTPMQEAWLGGYWDGMAAFVRSLFNATFKTNPALGRALMTGITRVTQESIFSDMNNLEVVTTTSGKYATAFGFTEAEVFASLDEMGYDEQARADVRDWYDGFTFGDVAHIYNPWSITNYLEKGLLLAYWANTSGNALVSRLVRTGGSSVQESFEELLRGGRVSAAVNELVTFAGLEESEDAIWSLLLASGYLHVAESELVDGEFHMRLALTNREVLVSFRGMVRQWFASTGGAYSGFTRSLLAGDLRNAARYLNDVLAACMSSFDGGAAGGGRTAPENFYHGLVLGLLVDLRGRYEVTSNRESGYGRYDVMLCPLRQSDLAFVLEFKVLDEDDGEESLEDTLAAARAQIAERDYARTLVERGIAPDRIREVGLAFTSKRVLIG